MTQAELEGLANGLVQSLREILPREIQKAVAPLEATVARLEQKLAALQTKAQDGLRFKGAWTAGEIYEPHDCVTWNGQMFCCRETHAANSFPSRLFTVMGG